MESHPTISLAKKYNITGSRELLLRDHARAQAFLAGVLGGGFKPTSGTNESAVNRTVSYLASVGVGKPPTNYDLIIDTGSSNTWVGAQVPFKETSTSKPTSNEVSVSYGSAESFSGKEYIDQVTLGPQLVVADQSIGVTDKLEGFDGVDGILGIGPTELTVGTLSPDTAQSVPTVTDSAFAQGNISNTAVGIALSPLVDGGSGELTWGGPDTTQITGDVNYVPITTTQPAGRYWGIDQSVSYGDGQTLLPTTSGVVDAGTTLVLLATDAFEAYKKVTGATLDNTTGLLRLTSAQFEQLQSLFFEIGGVQYELTPNAQIWPRSMNEAIGGREVDIYLIVSDLGSPSGQGLDFISGLAFLERFYTVYDSGNRQVGFATTPFTDAETN